MKFKPTYLYIKKHSVTGKLYFGKTTKSPIGYLGSGTYWKRHIKKHGTEFVINFWSHLFEDESECNEFAVFFSEYMDIVKSNDWANQIIETGTEYGSTGMVHTIEHKIKISEAVKKSWTPERKLKQSNATKGIPKPFGHGENVSKAHKGKPKSSEHKKAISDGWTPERKKEKSLKQLGSTLSESSKKKISEAWTPERKKAISDLHKGKTVSESTKKKLADAFTKRYIIRSESGEVFHAMSIKEFAKLLDVKEGTIYVSKNRKGSFRNYTFELLSSDIDGNS